MQSFSPTAYKSALTGFTPQQPRFAALPMLPFYHKQSQIYDATQSHRVVGNCGVTLLRAIKAAMLLKELTSANQASLSREITEEAIIQNLNTLFNQVETRGLGVFDQLQRLILQRSTDSPAFRMKIEGWLNSNKRSDLIDRNGGLTPIGNIAYLLQNNVQFKYFDFLLDDGLSQEHAADRVAAQKQIIHYLIQENRPIKVIDRHAKHTYLIGKDSSNQKFWVYDPLKDSIKWQDSTPLPRGGNAYIVFTKMKL